MKKGKNVIFGNTNWCLIIQMMIGIRMTLLKYDNLPKYLFPRHYTDKFRIQLDNQNLPKEGFKLLDYFTLDEEVNHQEFVSYYPYIFKHIRAFFHISDSQYLVYLFSLLAYFWPELTIWQFY